MDNIAEGVEKGTGIEMIQFLYHSKDSCGKFRSQLHCALDRNYLNQERFKGVYELTVTVGYMLFKLIAFLQASDSQAKQKKLSLENVSCKG